MWTGYLYGVFDSGSGYAVHIVFGPSLGLVRLGRQGIRRWPLLGIDRPDLARPGLAWPNSGANVVYTTSSVFPREKFTYVLVFSIGYLI